MSFERLLNMMHERGMRNVCNIIDIEKPFRFFCAVLGKLNLTFFPFNNEIPVERFRLRQFTRARLLALPGKFTLRGLKIFLFLQIVVIAAV